MEKEVFNGILGFWDYIAIAFRQKFVPKSIVEVGPARCSMFALPNGKTFFLASPRLQKTKPTESTGPLPMPRGSVVPFDIPGVENPFRTCTSASFELDDEFEAEIQQRDAAELATKFRPEETSSKQIQELQKAAEDLVTSRDGVDYIHRKES